MNSPEYKDFALGLAKQAGAIMKKDFGLNMSKKLKEDRTFVTETDLAINSLVAEAVKKQFPEHGTITEEAASDGEQKEFVWVCDPVDGTIPFSHGIPTSVFSLALVQNGKSILGVINDPFMNRLYYAEKGQGAFMNGEKISVNKNKTLSRSVTGFSMWNDATYNFFPVIEELTKQDAIIIAVMSAVYMGAMVANGEFTATIFPGNKPWDSAAVKILVEEAGGKVTDIFGKESAYNGLVKGHVASNGILHQEIIDIIAAKLKILANEK